MSIVYFNGHFVDESAALIPLTTHALHYGTAVFEGIRSYGNGQRALIFRARDHYERLLRNAALLDMKLTLSVDDLIALSIELLRRNQFFDDRYIRPLIFKNAQKIGAGLPEGESVAILAQTMPHAPLSRKAVRATWSKWRRFPAAACPAGAKITGLYVNSSLARADALARGYDQPIMLTLAGDVAEGYGANIFAIFGKRIVTPPPEADILPGITRATLMEYFESRADLTMAVETITPEKLQAADELFFCGTGMEMLPIGELEGKQIGDGKTAGPITTETITWFQNVVSAGNAQYAHWLTEVRP